MTRRTLPALGALALPAVAALLTACSSAPAPPASAAPAAPAPGPVRDTTAACASLVRIDTTIPPGIDPDGPPPPPDAMRAWAAEVEPDFATLRANAPDSLSSSLDVMAGQLAGAQRGEPIDASDPAGAQASAAVDAWAYDACGFPTLDVAFDGTAFAPFASTFAPGPVALRFTNTGDPAGFVLLLARVKDGQTATAADVAAGRADFDAVADVVTAAQPLGPQPGHSMAALQPGRYLVATPVGVPPQFTGVVAGEITVS